MNAKPSQPLDFRGPAGRLEGLLTLPESDPVAATVLCHAHPLYGGIMRFKLLHRVANALAGNGVAVLRFHFRGVGGSEGHFDYGVGEQDDCHAALDELARRVPAVPLLVGGFSFGAAVAMNVAGHDVRLRRAFALGFPLRAVRERPSLDQLPWPCLFLQGEHDEFGAADEIEEVVAPLPQRHELVIVTGSDHFFTGHYEQVESNLAKWVARRPWGAP